MKLKTKRRLSAWQALSLIAAIGVVVSSVTFAALRSQNNVLSGSKLTSTSADMYIAKQDNGQWFNTLTGFDFLDIFPGGDPGPKTGNNLYFRNGGSSNLDLRVSINNANLTNQYGMKLDKVRLVIVDGSGNTEFARPTLAQLISAYNTGTTLPVNIVLGSNTVTNLRVLMQIEDGAVNSSSQAALENIDIVFSGIAQNG